jgi:hypothetical protein
MKGRKERRKEGRKESKEVDHVIEGYREARVEESAVGVGKQGRRTGRLSVGSQ